MTSATENHPSAAVVKLEDRRTGDTGNARENSNQAPAGYPTAGVYCVQGQTAVIYWYSCFIWFRTGVDMLPPAVFFRFARAYSKRIALLMSVLVIAGIFIFAGGDDAKAGPATANSTQPEQLTDKLEPPVVCAGCHTEPYKDWSGSMMGNDFRDPSWLAALSIAEQDVPGVGDYCLRCHGAGWFEGKSEPPGGDFLGRSFEAPPKIDRESIPLCDFCHRVERVGERESRHDGDKIAEGNGSVFIKHDDPWKGGKHPLKDIHKKGEFCGSCHDVSNPLVKNTEVPDMSHPLERTYTEWKYSYFGENDFTCQQCHPPMKFPGAQTWILYPGLSLLYPDVDAGWADAGFNVRKDRNQVLRKARERNETFMRRAGDINIAEPKTVESGQESVIEVTVVNNTGHRLPTGFAEGRHMWIHLKVTDADGRNIFEDGQLDENGKLVETEQTKIYEQKAGVDGVKSFHFALLNTIIKDNRIPPAGFNKEAYEAEGAFIVGADYESGQNWDVTKYKFKVPDYAVGPLTAKATLKYETFSAEYMEWLLETDKTPGENHGGPAAATPDGSLTWGETTYKIWEREAKGRPVKMASTTMDIPVKGDVAMSVIPMASGALILAVLAIFGVRRFKGSKNVLPPLLDSHE